MTVKELIDRLREYPPETRVGVSESGEGRPVDVRGTFEEGERVVTVVLYGRPSP